MRKAVMAAEDYGVGSENGDRVDDLSENALFMMPRELDSGDNTFVVVQPDDDEPVRIASMTVLDEEGFEVVLRDTGHNEHHASVSSSVRYIARDLTAWPAARVFHGRPARQIADFSNSA
jgi:hypothetical protein